MNPLYTIDEANQVLRTADAEMDLYSPEALSVLSQLWVKIGWANKYSYQFTWMGRPIIQLPEDMLRTQEIIFSLKPDVIVETGVAHGGSLIFYASLLKLLGGRQVIGVDIEIREHNKKAILDHPLASLIHLIEGSSDNETVLQQVSASLTPEDKVLVFLDSNHSYEHVLKELHAYAPLVSVGSYLVATDGVMQDLVGVPGSQEDWSWNNPQKAVQTFLETNPQFVLESPQALFNESTSATYPTYWPNGWLKRVF